MPPYNQIRRSSQSDATNRRGSTGATEEGALMGSCEKEPYIVTLGGRIRCPRCQAKSKRTQKQCRSPAIRGKRVCKLHGGLSNGPRTQEGRNRCGAAKTMHGRETRSKRVKRRQKLTELKVLERLAKGAGMMP